MLEYEWAANPSAMMLPGGEEPEPADQTRQVFDQYSAAAAHQSFSDSHQLLPPQPPSSALFHSQSTSFFDPRATTYTGYVAGNPPQQSFLSFEQISAGHANNPYFLVPKSEEVDPDFSSRIGLNLGGRTYFSSAEDDFVSRLYRRSRSTMEQGGGGGANNAPRCQAEGCTVDLTHAKHYHRRHKVCEFHSKASTVIAAGLTQRFCQQCSRFHVLTEFDNGKRSCRKRLADHNRRRRKSHQNAINNLQQISREAAAPIESGATESPSHSLTTARSPSDSGVQSLSSVTVAVSPPRMFLDCFKQRPPYQATASSSSSASSSSLFFLSG